MTHSIDYRGYYLVFRDISRLVHSTSSVDEVIRLAVTKTAELLHAKGCLMRVRNPETGEFEVAAACGIAERFLNKPPVSCRQILDDLRGGEKVRIFRDIWAAPRTDSPQQVWDEGVRMLLDVPLYHDEELLGLIRAYLSEAHDFEQAELDFVVSLGEQCACALNKARLIETQRNHYDRLILQTEKLSALGRMAAGIAHEINNPLAGILLYGSNMLKKTEPDSPFRQGLEIIVRETSRCKGIIQELLEFSRHKTPKKCPTRINEIIEKALSLVDNELMLRHIKVEKRLAQDMENILLDGNQMEQVFVNLLLNAAQAIDKNGHIVIETRMDPCRRMEIVEITDDGCGIAPMDATRLFEPFYSNKNTGTGLGLAVSYGIVRNHNGHIKVASRMGGGTRFTIELPVDGASGAEPSDRGAMHGTP
ncbi:MAG TPA: sensor histidine kinase [Desulfobacteraceae bacterium]|nr:GAF domain-containing protein [Deltaproteobacteria bacterium]HDI59873.1 sensor histidine kinase [Desulfobacteraceae bacterium]